MLKNTPNTLSWYSDGLGHHRMCVNGWMRIGEGNVSYAHLDSTIQLCTVAAWTACARVLVVGILCVHPVVGALPPSAQIEVVQ